MVASTSENSSDMKNGFTWLAWLLKREFWKDVK